MSIYRTINPATGVTEKSFETHSDAEMFAKLDKAHTLWKDDWRLRSFAERRAIVQKAAETLRRDKENRNRRLAKDFEQTIASAAAWLFIASIQLFARRIARS